MQVITSWTFEASNLEIDHWIMSAGRWDTMEQATKAAASFLVKALETSANAYGVRVISVSEYRIEE
jgi:hypothetical protein